MKQQLITDLHRAFVKFQESLVSLQDDRNVLQDQSKLLDQISREALLSYRSILQMESNDDDGYLKECSSYLGLLELTLWKWKGRPIDIIQLEAWLEESYPITVDQSFHVEKGEFWNILYSFAVRRRYDQVCLLLQRALDDKTSFFSIKCFSQVQTITELLLAFPTARQRAQNNYGPIDAWLGDVRSRMKAEDLSSWDPRLGKLFAIIEGREFEAYCNGWKELYVAKAFWNRCSSADLLKECISKKPSSYETLDLACSQCLNHEMFTLEFFQNISALPYIGVHLIDILSHRNNIIELRNNALISYGELMWSSPCWNLAADYFWVSSATGRAKFESFLFEKAQLSSILSEKLEIIDVCRSFDLFLLADAIHLLISEQALQVQEYPKALYYALMARQPSMVTRICDQVLRSFFQFKDLSLLDDLVEEDSFDLGPFPRLQLLLQISKLQTLINEGDYQLASSVLTDSLLNKSHLLIPEYLRPHLLLFFLKTAENALVQLPMNLIKVLLIFINESSNGLSEDQLLQVRLHFNRLACLNFTSF